MSDLEKLRGWSRASPEQTKGDPVKYIRAALTVEAIKLAPEIAATQGYAEGAYLIVGPKGEQYLQNAEDFEHDFVIAKKRGRKASTMLKPQIPRKPRGRKALGTSPLSDGAEAAPAA